MNTPRIPYSLVLTGTKSGRNKLRRNRQLLFAALAAISFTESAQATAVTWKTFSSTTTGAWSTAASWTTGTAPSLSDPSTVINFTPTGSVSATFTSNNDLGTVQLNQLSLAGASDSTSTSRTITISGGTLAFQGASATIANTTTTNGTSLVNYTISSAITTGTDLSLALNGTGLTILSGSITASSTGIKTITASGVGKAQLNGNIGDGSGTIALVKAGSGLLTLSGSNSFSGGVTIKAGELVANNTGTANVTGYAFGTGTVTLGDSSGSASATLTGSGNNSNPTYTNAINIAAGSSGVLTIRGTGIYSTKFTGAVSLNNNLTLDKTVGGSLSLSGTITGGATTGNTYTITNIAAGGVYLGIINDGTGGGKVAVVQSGTGALTLSGTSSTFSGGLTVKSGEVIGYNQGSGNITGNAFGTGTITLGDSSGSASATLTGTAPSANVTYNNAINVAGGSTGTLTIRGQGSLLTKFTGPVSLNNNLTLDKSAGASSLTLSGTVTGGATTGNIYTITSIAAGAVNLGTINDGTGGGKVAMVQAGSGTLTLSATASSFSGGLTIKSGEVIGTNTVGSGVIGSTAFGTGIITLGDSSGSASATLTGSAPSTSVVYSNAITVAAGNTGTLTIRGLGNWATTFTGAVFLNNNLTLDKTVGYNLSLSGTITGGATTGNVYTITSIAAGGVNLGTISDGSAGGKVALVQAGSGNLTLSSSNSFSGGVTVTSGTVQLANANALNANSQVNVASGATLLSGTASTAAGIVTTIGGLSDYSGSGGTVTTTGTSTGTLMLSGTSTYSFSGAITDGTGAATALNKNGTGTQTLLGTNTYTGSTTVSAGTLQIGNGTTGSIASANTSVAANANLSFNQANGSAYAGAIANNGTINAMASGTNTLAGNISGNGVFNQKGTGSTVLSGNNTYSGATSVSSGELDITGTSSNSAVSLSSHTTLGGSGRINGTVHVSGATVNGSGLTLAGATTFDGASTLTGITTASGGITATSGTLAVTGTTTGNISVSAGATLNGTGKVEGGLTINGGILSPAAAGASTEATLTSTGAVTFTNIEASTLAVRLGVTSSMACDSLSVGSIDLGTMTTLNLTLGDAFIANADNLIGTSWTIISSGATSGLFTTGSSITISTSNADYTFAINYGSGASNNDVTLELMAVPEPSTWAMILGGFGTLVAMQKVRRKTTV